MASKGGQTTLKRIAASKSRRLDRKALSWTIKTAPGPHNSNNSVPLGFVLRELTGIAANLKEAKILLNAGKVSVDSVVRESHKFPVGLFDVVQVEEIKKAFRLVFDSHGRLEAREIKFAPKQQKICRIVGKKIAKENKVQLVLNDGKSLLFVAKEAFAKAKPGDSILLDLPNTPKQLLEMKKGNTAFVVGGKHVGDIVKISDVGSSTMQRPKLLKLEAGNDSYTTVAENVFVIGEAKQAIEF